MQRYSGAQAPIMVQMYVWDAHSLRLSWPTRNFCSTSHCNFRFEFRAIIAAADLESEQRKMFSLVVIAWAVVVRADMVPNLEVSLVRRRFYWWTM